MRTFWDFTKADLQMVLRNRQALFWTFFFPVLLMGLMGVVFGQESAFTASLGIVDEDGGPAARQVIDVFRHVPAVTVAVGTDESQMLSYLKDGRHAAVLVLPQGLESQVGHSSLSLPYFYDNSSLIEASGVNNVVQQVLTEMSYRATHTQPAFTLRMQGVAAKGFNYIDFLVPGVVAMALMTSGVYGVSGTFVEYRQRGVLRRLKATPMPLSSFIGARVLVSLITALLQAGLVIAVGVFLFHVHIMGGMTALNVVLLALLGASSFITIGFFVAAISKNVESAAARGQVIGPPMMFLSGIFFPMDSAPAWIQPVVRAMPLKYLADALRAVIINGHGLWFVRWDVAVLVAVSGAFLILSVRFFRWE